MVAIAGRRIGAGHPVFVIAEAGVNHNGDPERALALVDAAVDAGADAVKFQTFSADRLALAAAPKAAYQQAAGAPGEDQRAMLRRLELDEAAHRRLIARAGERGLVFLSSPFDEESADMLARLGVAAFKVASGEITNHPFLARLAGYGRPLIVSTGMATLTEVEAAVAAIAAAGAPSMILLHCVSAYPAAPADCNLRALITLSERFGVPVGWSDHTEGTEVAVAAVAVGAVVVEKHLTLDRGLPGPDHQASLDPPAFAAMVAGIRAAEVALGDGRKAPRPVEREIAAVARKSLVAARDLGAGEALQAAHVAARRPGTGIPPAALPGLLGRRLKVAVAAWTPLDPDMFE